MSLTTPTRALLVSLALACAALLLPQLAWAQAAPPAGTPPAGGTSPTADEPNFDPVGNILSNPAQPGPGFCLLNFFCELDPTKSPIESFGYRIYRLISTFLGILFIAILIYGGYLTLTSFGDEAQAKKGREAIIAALVGFILLLLSYAAVRTFVDFAKS